MTTERIDAKKISRGISTDMSPEAVTRRLQICSDLSADCRELGNAVVISGKANTDGQTHTAPGPILRPETSELCDFAKRLFDNGAGVTVKDGK